MAPKVRLVYDERYGHTMARKPGSEIMWVYMKDSSRWIFRNMFSAAAAFKSDYNRLEAMILHL